MNNRSRGETRSRIPGWGKAVIRALVLSLVILGIWRTVVDAQHELVEMKFTLADLHVGWMALAGFLYAIGMFPSCLFWKRTLQAMGQRPTWWATLRAFYVGHLGKYVPGKALVVVLRTNLIRGPNVDATVAAVSVFVETLTFMAVGAAVAAAMLLLRYADLAHQQRLLVLLAILLAASTGIPTWPPIFRRIIRALQVHRLNPQVDEAVAGIDFRLMAFGWLTIAFGWSCFGASLWASLNAIPAPFLAPQPLFHDWSLLTAAVALAMVAGFLSLIPAGAFVREFVVITLLEPTYGPTVAVLSAVVLRIVWLLTEVAVAGPAFLAGGKKECEGGKV